MTQDVTKYKNKVKENSSYVQSRLGEKIDRKI